MTRRQYSNTATEATLTGGAASADTSITLTSFAGYPAAPFTATISRGAADEEVVLVTAVSSSTVTVTRGYDGTTAKSHAAGSTFTHTTVAKDFDEANAHVNTATAVHGLTGAVVGTTDAQTLTNKTLTSPVLAGPTATGTSAMANATVSGTLSVTGVSTLAAVNATSASLSGTLAVSGATTLAGLTAGATGLSSVTVSGVSTLTGAATFGSTATFTGAVTLTGGVAGALTATGAVSGTTVTGSGLVKGAGLETTQALQLAQIAAPAGTAAKDTIYAKADGGLYLKNGTGAETRVKVNFGSGTTVPGSGMLAGDTYDHNTAGVLVYDGANWRKGSIGGATYKNAGSEVTGDAAAPPRWYGGKATASFSAVSFAVFTFDYTAAGFAEAPTVVVTPEGASTYDLRGTVDSVSATSVQVTVRSPINITASVAVNVLAYGR